MPQNSIMEEIWLDNDKLIEEQAWKRLIADLKENVMSAEDQEHKHETIKNYLKQKIFQAVQKRMPKKKFGIFFSGGVDSSFLAAICKENKANFICYTVGFQDEQTKEAEDIVEAKKVAKKLGFELRYKIFNLEEAEQIIKETVKILKPKDKIDVVNIGVGAVVVAAINIAREERIDYFFSGLGSEEIFAGYERHEKAEHKNEECWNGLMQMWSRDLVRDTTIAKNKQVMIRTPFLDKELIEYAMQIPEEWKINKEEKKIILREVAEEFLGKFAWRKKKAAQYGSCFDKAISKLARMKGFKFKKDYLDSL